MAVWASATWCSTARAVTSSKLRLDRPGEDVALTYVEVRRTRIDERQVEIQRHGLPIRGRSLGEPGGHGAVAAPDLQRPRPGSDAKRLDVAAVHRIEQPRHQRQPLALAGW